jgi:diaminopimelate decarboxylase
MMAVDHPHGTCGPNCEAFEAGCRQFLDPDTHAIFTVRRHDGADTIVVAGRLCDPGDFILSGSGSTRAVTPKEFERLEPITEE